jgi:hypothetical protein
VAAVVGGRSVAHAGKPAGQDGGDEGALGISGSIFSGRTSPEEAASAVLPKMPGISKQAWIIATFG